MSGLDPLAALAAQAVANAQAAMDAAVLSLGVDVAVLQAQVNVGEVIAATVLPPQGGTDLLSFLGQTVMAQIPPGINPGETMLLQVTGFTNSAVIVKNLGTLDPQNPIPTVNVELPPQAPGAAQSAILTTTIPLEATPAATVVSTPPATAAPVPPASPQLPQQAQQPQQPATINPNVAPPREVFVAASVRQTTPVEPTEQTVAAAIEAVEDEVLTTGSDVEARLALNRASAPAPPPMPATRETPPAPAASSVSQTASARVVPRSIPVAPPIVRPAASAAPAPAPRAPATTEGTLLTRLRVPVTPITLAAARSMNTATQSLTRAYENLESALAKLAPQENGALRSMLAFVGRFDLRNVRALPEQIATFVSDVLDGAEAKIVQAVSAWNELEEIPVVATQPDVPGAQPPAPGAQPQAPVAQPQAPAAPPPQVAAAQQTPSSVAAVAAQAAERTAAMDYDVKAAILSMIAAPASSDSPAIAGALREALTATTALQLNVLNAQANDPRAITIPLPAYFYEGGEPAALRISRDAPNGKNKLDADNFHIAFILDTKSLGTVAIDVQTVGRAVSVDVKTQATPAADRFRSTLGDLRSRLEQMRYHVAAIGAGVAPPSTEQVAKTEPASPVERKSFWDMRA
jgi:Flagellar hook-length control protein FliK